MVVETWFAELRADIEVSGKRDIWNVRPIDLKLVHDVGIEGVRFQDEHTSFELLVWVVVWNFGGKCDFN